MHLSRRTFLATVPGMTLAARRLAAAEPSDDRARGRDLAGLFGVTTGSFMRHVSPQPAPGKLVMLDLPKFMRDELGLKVIDLMTATVPSLSAEYCDKFREQSEKAGTVISNLKMNQKELDLAAADEPLRRHSIEVYKQTMDSAARLGCRWVRPATPPGKQDLDRLAAGFRELIEYGADKRLTLLVENNGWMQREPDAIPQIVAAVGKGIGVQPDTGNWKPDVRYAGLEKAFPLAVSCDFKALKLGPDGEHADYDLRRCFDIAWRAGYRGPWCFEHFHEELAGLFKDLVRLREMLTQWTSENMKSDAAKRTSS